MSSRYPAKWSSHLRTTRNSKRTSKRRLIIEALESRTLLNVDWRNPVDSLDVDVDGTVSPLDVLTIVNYINSGQVSRLPSQHTLGKPFFDVDGDQTVSPLDVLSIINSINAGQSSRVLRESAGSLASQSQVAINLGQPRGTRHYQVQIAPHFDTSDTTSSVGDILNVYLVNPSNLSSTILDRGKLGTSLFSLSEAKADVIAGRVTWDGSILDVDLSDSPTLDTGVLLFQLLNNDSDSGSTVSITPLTNNIDLNGVVSPRVDSIDTTHDAGAALDLSKLHNVNGYDVQYSNIYFDSLSSTLQADVQVQSSVEPLGRNAVLIYAGLPSGDTLLNRSGTTSAGASYVSLKPSLSLMGLPLNTWSMPTHVSFSVKGASPLAQKPALMGATNHAPVLSPLSPQSLSPGAVLKLALHATDEDSDGLVYRLENPSSLPSGSIDSSGTLTFRPLANQIGHYTVSVDVTDGITTTSQSTTLDVVPDSSTSTRVSGQVLKVDGSPLAGMPVEIGAVQALTAADGSFTLDLGANPVVSDTIKVRGDKFSNGAYPFIGEKIPLLLMHDVIAHNNNVIDRPIYLPVLDTAHATQIDPTKDQTVSNPALPGTSVYVAAGTLMNLQGSPFTGKLSITQVPANLTPAALPSDLKPGFLVTIQPGDMLFARPAPLTLPNTDKWGPGTLMNLWSINPASGQFDNVGDMQVSADGKTVETISGGVRNSSWHFAVPNAPSSLTRGSSRNVTISCKACDVKEAATSQVEAHTGALIETHDLVTYQSQGIDRRLTLTYDSLRADPRPIVHFGVDKIDSYSLLSGFEADGRYVAHLSVQAGSFEEAVPGAPASGDPSRGIEPANVDGGKYPDDEHYWMIDHVKGSIDVALQVDLSDQPTGVYKYTLDSGVLISAIESDLIVFGTYFVGVSSTKTDELVSVNTIHGPFGAGWGIAGMESIARADDGSALIVDGDGTQLLFKLDSATKKFVSPAGDFSSLSLADGKFTRTMPSQLTYFFNPNGSLDTIVDRNHNVTSYSYDSQGRPLAIIDPVGLSTTFEYTGDRVSSITDPAGRITKLNYDANGNLTKITDPDGSARRWSYDALHHQTGEIDQLGNRETDVYGFHGRLISATRKDGTTINVHSPETDGLLEPDATIDWKHAPHVLSLSEDATSTYLDSNGNVTTNVLDQAGQAVATSDALGILPTVKRSVNNQPLTITNARGQTLENTFDARGNLSTTRDSLSIRIGDDPGTVGVMKGTFQHYNQTDQYSFFAQAGDQIWIDSMEGSRSIYLTSPTGAYPDYFNGPLNETGTYVVSIPQGELGTNYSVAVRSLTHAPVLLMNTTIERPTDQFEDIVYQFTAQKNQRFVLHDDTQPQSGIEWRIPSLKVSYANYPQTGTEGSNTEFLIPQDGVYYLIRGVYPDQTDPKKIVKIRASLVDPTPIERQGFNITYSGNLAADSTKEIPFVAAQGDVINVNALAGYLANIQILDPLGRDIGRDTRFNLLLSMSGMYTAKISNPISQDLAYNFRLLNFVDAVPATPNTEIRDTLQSGETKIYRMHANEGQQLFIEDINRNASVAFYDKFGNSAFSNSIPTSDDYYLSVQASVASSEPITTDVRITDLQTVPQRSIDAISSGTFSSPTDELIYRIPNVRLQETNNFYV